MDLFLAFDYAYFWLVTTVTGFEVMLPQGGVCSGHFSAVDHLLAFLALRWSWFVNNLW